MNPRPLDPYVNWLRSSSTVRWTGRVTQVVGNLVESAGPFCSVGANVVIEDREEMFPLYHVYYLQEKVKRPPRDIRAWSVFWAP